MPSLLKPQSSRLNGNMTPTKLVLTILKHARTYTTSMVPPSLSRYNNILYTDAVSIPLIPDVIWHLAQHLYISPAPPIGAFCGLFYLFRVVFAPPTNPMRLAICVIGWPERDAIGGEVAQWILLTPYFLLFPPRPRFLAPLTVPSVNHSILNGWLI